MRAFEPVSLLCRSLLNTPALDAARFSKAAESNADVGVVDLEDPIPLGAKAAARRLAVEFLSAPACGDTLRGVRVNSLRSPDGLRDLLALLDGGARPDLLLLPKVESPDEVRLVDELLSPALPGTSLLAIIETARGVKAVEEIALASPRLRGLVFGAADMAARLGVVGGWENLLYVRSRIVMAAALGGLMAVDSPFFDLGDEAGLRLEIRRARELGFVGKIAIHPRQVAAIQEGFQPGPEAVARAREVVARAPESGEGIYLVRGEMIGPPLLRMARRMLALAREDFGPLAGGAPPPGKAAAAQASDEEGT